MLVAEIEPQALVARRGADDRQHVGQAGPAPEPGLRVAPLGEREELARPSGSSRSRWADDGGSSRRANSAPVVSRTPRVIGVRT